MRGTASQETARTRAPLDIESRQPAGGVEHAQLWMLAFEIRDEQGDNSGVVQVPELQRHAGMAAGTGRDHFEAEEFALFGAGKQETPRVTRAVPYRQRANRGTEKLAAGQFEARVNQPAKAQVA